MRIIVRGQCGYELDAGTLTRMSATLCTTLGGAVTQNLNRMGTGSLGTYVVNRPSNRHVSRTCGVIVS